MSDPVTNVEIEDVLSSIRKLVAEETRTAPPVRKPAEPERLVLTPAQRIPEAAQQSSDPVVLSDRVPETAATVKVVENKPIDDIPGDARLSEYGDVEGAFPDIDTFEAAQSEPDAISGEETEADSSSDRVELGRMIEQEVAAALGVVHQDDDADEPNDEDAASFTDSDDDIDWDALDVSEDPEEIPDAVEDTDTIEFTEAEPEDIEARISPDVAAEAPPQTLEDKVAALGRLVARDTGEFEEEREAPIELAEPVTPDPDAWLPDAFDHAPAENVDSDDVALSGLDDPQVDTSLPETEESQTVSAENAAVDVDADLPADALDAPVTPPMDAALQIDEDDLREMVGDIVRQELQGALGERITRNVRKLVRREIHRMLISQELE